MKECRKYNYNDLFFYANDLLSHIQRRNIEKHLNQCSNCKMEFEKILRLKEVLYNTPKLTAENNISFILNEAKKREKQFNFSSFFNSIIYTIREKILFFKNLRLGIQAGFCLLIVLLLSIFLLLPRQEKVYVVRAYGKIIINDKDFFSSNKYKYNLKDRLNIKVEAGECVLQINKEKLIIVKKNSDIILTEEKDTILDLQKGKIICSVKNLEGKKKFIIKTEKTEFKVMGTKFYIEKVNGFTELMVKEGEIEARFNKEVFHIDKNKLFWIRDNKVSINEILEIELKYFDELNTIEFIDDLSKIKAINIKGYPQDSKVYRESKIVGETPFFMLSDSSSRKRHFIYNKGFIPEEIKLDEDKSVVYDFKLKKQKLPELLWKYKLPTKIFLKPIKINNYFIIPGVNGIIYKFNLNKQQIIWEHKINHSISIRPLFHNNIIYFASDAGYLFSIDFKSGELIWKKGIGTLVDSNPVIYNERLYFGNNNGVLYCLDIKKGKTLWSKKFNKGFFSSPIIKDNILYIGNLNGYLYALNILNKEIIWKFKTEDKIVSTTPVIKNNLIFLSSYDKYIYAIDYKNGKLKWKYKTDSEILTSPLIIEDIIVITSSKGIIYALTYKDGKLKWNYETEGEILIKSVLIDNKFILFGDKKNNLYLLNKYGIEYLKYKHDFYNYIVFNKNILIIGEKGLLYNFLINYL